MHDKLRAQLGEREPPGVEVTALTERDHLLCEWLDRLGLGLRGLDPAVLDQRARQVRVQGLTVRRVATELLACATVTHQWPCRSRSWMPRSRAPSETRTQALGLVCPNATED